MTATPPPTGVGRTALGAASIRAEETRRADPLFTDPYAQLFVEAAPGALPEHRAGGADPDARGLVGIGAAFACYAVLRTWFFDDWLLAVTGRGIRQVVLLGAGLDARAFRLDWPAGVELLELDLPELLAFKQEVLDSVGARPRCARRVVATDLGADWAPGLRAAGVDPTRPVAWLAEGLLTYLDHDQAQRLLATITRLSVPGALLAFDGGRIGTAGFMADAMALPAMAELVALHRGGLDGDPGDWLTEHGWRVAVQDGRDVAERQRRGVRHAATARFVVATRTGER